MIDTLETLAIPGTCCGPGMTDIGGWRVIEQTVLAEVDLENPTSTHLELSLESKRPIWLTCRILLLCGHWLFGGRNLGHLWVCSVLAILATSHLAEPMHGAVRGVNRHDFDQWRRVGLAAMDNRVI